MANSDYEVRGSGDFTPVAQLSGAVDYFDDTFNIINLVGVEDDTELSVGMAALIDEEIVRVTEVAEDLSYVKVARGCADTIPAQHANGALIWFYEETIATDWRAYLGGETVAVKVLPRTPAGAFPVEMAPPNEITFNWRFTRPYPPGQMQQNGQPWFDAQELSAEDPNLVLTWVHRDRVAQQDQLVDHFAASVGPEAGVTYVARIYEQGSSVPIRVETGITGETWTYTWEQAMDDFDGYSNMDTILNGVIEFAARRDGFDSWQVYHLPFKLDTHAPMMLMSSMMMMTSQEDELDPVPLSGALVSSMRTLTSQEAPEDFASVPLHGVLMSQLTNVNAQEAYYYTPLTRTLFELPYTYHIRHDGADPPTAAVMCVAARPSDRLSDQHMIYSRNGTPPVNQPFLLRATGPYTPWVALEEQLDFLTTTATIKTSSEFDGVSLEAVLPGQLGLMGTELVRVVSISGSTITIVRGCCDTVPKRHYPNTRIWFFEAAGVRDNTPRPRPVGNADKRPVQFKDAPVVSGSLVELDWLPTDKLDLQQRKWRPLPPRQVTLNGKHWYEGAVAEPGKVIKIRWAHQNRITQGGDVYGHVESAGVTPEPGTIYHFYMGVTVRPQNGEPYDIVIRDVAIDGTAFDYTYEMALEDGYRISRILDLCGYVTFGAILYAERDGLMNWQSYVLPLLLPAPACPPDRPPGGGGGWPGAGGSWPGGWPGGGNGTPGVPGGAPPPGADPGIPGGDGSTPPPPTEPPNPLPDDWPDDPELPEPPPQEPPEGDGKWDFNWDIFWAAYGQGDDPGD